MPTHRATSDSTARHGPYLPFRIAVVMLLKIFYALAMVAVVIGTLRAFYMFRAGAMRALATKWGLQYLGPPAPTSRNPFQLDPTTRVPAWISHFKPSGWHISAVWNVMEGKRNGVTIHIFDCVLGENRNSHPCTLIACQTEQDPFGVVTWPDRKFLRNTGKHPLHLDCTPLPPTRRIHRAKIQLRSDRT
jgi:hypothetical protein